VPHLAKRIALQDFTLYFKLGIEHILDWQGYDHILFMMALCGVYTWEDWRKIIVLVTAFTIGHSLTLALSVLNYLPMAMPLIEFLIPVTIIFTTLANILQNKHTPRNQSLIYLLALLFGLIHGLGFSYYLKSLLGSEIIFQLLAFNIGLEIGQLVIVFFTLILTFFIINLFNVNRRDWTLFLSAAIFGIALTMALSRVNPLLS